MTQITYTATIQTMGDADDADADRYVAALRTALSEQFPGAQVEVERDDRLSSSTIRGSEDVDADEVRRVAQRVWDAGETLDAMLERHRRELDEVFPNRAPKAWPETAELVECLTADGWSLHAPGSTDEAIACGDAAPLASGPGRPTEADRAHAWLKLAGEA